jgi:hypothetical protein
MQLADRSLGPILPLYLREIGVAPESVAFLAGILFTITAGSAAIGNLSSRWLLTQRSEGVLVAVMVGFASIAALVFAAGPPVGFCLVPRRLRPGTRCRHDFDLYGGVAVGFG